MQCDRENELSRFCEFTVTLFYRGDQATFVVNVEGVTFGGKMLIVCMRAIDNLRAVPFLVLRELTLI